MTGFIPGPALIPEHPVTTDTEHKSILLLAKFWGYLCRGCCWSHPSLPAWVSGSLGERPQ